MISPVEMNKLDVRPIPRHMHPQHDAERRKARAQALTKDHAEDEGAAHVDAARHGDHFVAAVVKVCDGKLVTAASIKTQEVRVAEEVAITLAAFAHSDSVMAIRNFVRARELRGRKDVKKRLSEQGNNQVVPGARSRERGGGREGSHVT